MINNRRLASARHYAYDVIEMCAPLCHSLHCAGSATYMRLPIPNPNANPNYPNHRDHNPRTHYIPIRVNKIRFDSIRQFDKMDACIGVMIFLSIAEFLFSNQ